MQYVVAMWGRLAGGGGANDKHLEQHFIAGGAMF